MKKILRCVCIAGIIVGFSLHGFAQSKRIALVKHKSQENKFNDQFLTGFMNTLRMAEEKCIIDEYDLAEFNSLAKIKNGNYDAICSLGTGATKALQKEITDTPIIFSMLLNPVGMGIVKNMRSSGSNVTGVSLDVGPQNQLRLLKKIIPTAKTVGILYGGENIDFVHEARAQAPDFNVDIKAVKIASTIEVPTAIKNNFGQTDVLWLIPDTTVCSKDTLSFIMDYSMKNKLPVMVFMPYLVKSGGVFCYTIDYQDIGRQTMEKILMIVRGESAGSIPIASSRKIGYVLNLSLARYFGIFVSANVINEAEEIIR